MVGAPLDPSHHGTGALCGKTNAANRELYIFVWSQKSQESTLRQTNLEPENPLFIMDLPLKMVIFSFPAKFATDLAKDFHYPSLDGGTVSHTVLGHQIGGPPLYAALQRSSPSLNIQRYGYAKI